MRKLIMRNIAILCLLTWISIVQGLGNVKYINISKISSDLEHIIAFNIISLYEPYYENWTSEWNFDQPKERMIQLLQEYYKDFSAITEKDAETYLLLGVIAGYLYNMDESMYHSIAIENFEEAIKIDPQDYRAYWFLANHCSRSAVSVAAIENFKKAEELLPDQPPVDFWKDYAWAARFAIMPSHFFYAYEKMKRLAKNVDSQLQELADRTYELKVPIDKNKSFDKQELWAISVGEKITMTSRPLGIKITLDSIWQIGVHDYQQNVTAFVIFPTTIANKLGKEIGYTFAIMMRTVNDDDQLDDYVNSISYSKDAIKKKINFSDKYERMVAYEITDKSLYPDMGGGHLYIIGIERNEPEYPGLLLESPTTLKNDEKNQLQVYRLLECKERFKGKIFYVFLFDSCEDIYQQSFAVFKSFFDNQIIIE